MSSKPSTSKKKGRVVPSRFKQAAETFTSQSSKRSVEDSKLQSRSYSPRRFERESQQKSLVSGKSELSVTKCENIKKCTSSTPNSVGNYTLPPIDESVIAKAENSLYVPCGKAVLGATLREEMPKTLLQKNKETGQTLNATMFSQRGRKKSNQANLCDQSEINLLYAEYLQAKLLESRAKKAFHNRCRDALNNIYEVWSCIGVLMGKNTKVLKDMNVVNYFLMAHEHICKQDEMLLPTLKILPSLEKQYETIAKAVDTARHNLEIKDIVIPDDDCEKEIAHLLHKIQALLRIIIKLVQDCDKVIAAAEMKSTLVNQGKLLLDEVTRASEMLSESSNLLLTETSLKLSDLN